MDSLLAWANSQPVWLQVVIGLTVFFVVLPLVLLSLYFLLRALALLIGAAVETVEALAKPFLFVALAAVPAYAAWWATGYVVELTAQSVATVLSVQPLSLAVLQLCQLVLFFAFVGAAAYAAYRCLPRVRARIKEWRNAIDPPSEA